MKEILLSKENFSSYFGDGSNTRNIASGVSRKHDGEGSDKLTVLVYQLTTEDIKISTQKERPVIFSFKFFQHSCFRVLFN